MANVDDVYSSGQHLKAEDLKGRAIKLIISGCEVVDFKEGGGKKLALKFQGKDKGMVLNKTNTKIVAKYFGKDYDKWAGKEIEIFPTETEFNGQLVPCIRVRIEPPKVACEDPFGDGIPF